MEVAESEDRLVKKVVALLNDCRGWWADYCELKRKFGVEEEMEVVGLCATWRNYVWDVHDEGWQEELGEKSSLKWYRLAKEKYGQEIHVKEFGSKGEVRLRFRLRTVSAGLLGDKERFGMCKDGKCELRDDVFWKLLYISCCTMASLLVIEEDYWL